MRTVLILLPKVRRKDGDAFSLENCSVHIVVYLPCSLTDVLLTKVLPRNFQPRNLSKGTFFPCACCLKFFLANQTLIPIFLQHQN